MVPRYSGITINEVGFRFKQHLRDQTNKLKEKWIKELGKQGKQPILTVIGQFEYEVARQKEIELIKEGRQLYGNLITNCTEGGDYYFTEEIEIPRRAAISATRRSNYIASESRTIWIENHPEIREKLRNLWKGKKRLKPCRQRRCISSEGMEFDSVLDAAKYYNLHPNTITDALTKGILRKGMTFKYLDEDFILNKNKQRAVIDEDTNEIFFSISEAAEYYNVDWKTVKTAIDSNRPFQGNKLKYFDEITEEDENEYKKETQIPILCSDGQFFPSVFHAAKFYGLNPDHISYGLTHSDIVDQKIFYYLDNKFKIKKTTQKVYGSDGSIYFSPGYLIDHLKCHFSTILHKALCYDRPVKGIKYSYIPFGKIDIPSLGQKRKGFKLFVDNKGNTFNAIFAASKFHNMNRKIIKAELENKRQTELNFKYLD
jgi:hypothetical protein